MTLMFKDVVEKILEDKFAYKNGQPHNLTISKIIAEREGKEFVPPVYDVFPKAFWNSFIVPRTQGQRLLRDGRTA